MKKFFLVEVESGERTRWIADDGVFMAIAERRLEMAAANCTAGPDPRVKLTQVPETWCPGKEGV